MAGFDRLAGVGIDARQDIEIDQAVIDRRHQRIGQRMGQPRQIGVKARRVDDQEIDAVLDLADRLAEQVELGLVVFLDRVAPGRRQVEMRGVRQLDRPRSCA